MDYCEGGITNALYTQFCLLHQLSIYYYISINFFFPFMLLMNKWSGSVIRLAMLSD